MGFPLQPQIFVASLTLTSAQVLALTVGYPLVPAPGAGNAVIALGAFFNLHFGGTPYTAGGGSVSVGPGAIAQVNLSQSGMISAAASVVNYVPAAAPGNTAIASWANLPLNVFAGANPTLGNGTLTVTVPYYIASGIS